MYENLENSPLQPLGLWLNMDEVLIWFLSMSSSVLLEVTFFLFFLLTLHEISLLGPQGLLGGL